MLAFLFYTLGNWLVWVLYFMTDLKERESHS